ncbi:hypothetical protein Agub_g6357 [Astrephomene gubernaculifera]|uniref:Uncharacterized protein n=1 Tax=Astrephomene gubernaculifera TaxID=47775 RepID=A0AAD3DNQ4_9CHLO|nr:hypothetical protein Agub_g6357 [Astrephomene gubernaculifera]
MNVILSTSHSPQARVSSLAYARRVSERRRTKTRTAAADPSSGALAIAGSLGIVGGTALAALYVLERQSREELQRKLVRLEQALQEREQQIATQQEEVKRAQEYARENDMFRTRYADAARDIFKLEKALELKDGQLETFMVVAQRQIAQLEQQVRRLQK